MNTNLNEVLNVTTKMNMHKANTYSPLALAYIGDGVYELFIRTYVLSRGNMPVNKMHKASRELVRATAQAKLYHLIEDKLTEEEMQVLKRGRNAKSISAPKNADITEYRHATGVEALIGYLYLEGKIGRINEIIEIGLNAL